VTGRRTWAAAVVVAAASAFGALWLYRVPPDYACSWGTNPEGAAHFRAALHVPLSVASAETFRAGLVAALGLAWLAYLTLLAAGLSSGGPPPGRVRLLAAGLAGGLALLAPPALSPDVYAYVGYARLAVVHHLDPYVETQLALVARHDPTAEFLRWPIASPYGPLWTLASMAIVFVLPKSSVLGPVLVFKLLGAASVLAIAEAGRRLARRFSPGREELAFAALALNPLFLLEGVANAHNDVVTMAFVAWALVAAVDARWTRAFLLLGIASSIKFVPLLLAPWVLLAELRAAPGRRVALTARAFALTVAPVVICYAAFWRGVETLAGLQSRSAHGLHPTGGSLGRGALVVLALWAALTPWVARDPLPRAARGWIVVSLAVVALLTGMWFPWYFVWPWVAALVLLERTNLAFTGIVTGATLLSLWSYVR
jgi:hypothetical protein